MKLIAPLMLCAVLIVGATPLTTAANTRAAVVAQETVDVTGTWALQIDLGGGQGGSPSVALKQEGEKLTGTYSSQVVGEHQVAGTVKGNAVTFGFEASFDGNAVKVTYSGTVDKDTMKGEATFGDFATGTFTGKKK
ncbi:MAG: hypothetical protein ACRD1U_16015 [Vicinamibacterales bacterium]